MRLIFPAQTLYSPLPADECDRLSPGLFRNSSGTLPGPAPPTLPATPTRPKGTTAWPGRQDPTPKPAGRCATGTVPPSAPSAPTPPRPKRSALDVPSSTEITSHIPTSSHPAMPRCCSGSTSPRSGGQRGSPPIPAPPRAPAASSPHDRAPLRQHALAQLDAHAAAAWQRDLAREGLSPAPSRPICRCSAPSATPPSTLATWITPPHHPRPPTTTRDPHRHVDRAIPAAHGLAHPPAGAAPRRRHRQPSAGTGTISTRRAHHRPRPASDRRPGRPP